MKSKSTVVTIAIVILVIGIIVGMLISNSFKEKDKETPTIPIVKENSTPSPTPSMEPSLTPELTLTPTPTSEELPSTNYISGDIVDIAIAKLSDSVVTVSDSLMDADGHVYEIYNQQDKTVNSIVIHLNKQFTTLNISVYNEAILGESGSDGVIIISDSTKDGEPIGNLIHSTAIPAAEIYPANISVDVTGLDYVVIVDQHQNLQTYNFNAIAK